MTDEGESGVAGDEGTVPGLVTSENTATSSGSESDLLLDQSDDDRKGKGRGSGEKEKGTLRRGINLLDATAMVIGGIIGSGIFITPAIILELTGSFGVSMLCWVAGLIIAVFGGLCFVELSLLLPRSGGQMVYIIECFSFKNRSKWTQLLGQLLAFLYIWSTIVIVQPSSVAIVALACTRYLTRPFYLDCDIPETLQKCFALAIAVLLAAIMIRGVKMMAKVNTVFAVMKVLTVIFVVIVGVAGIIQRGHFPESFKQPFQGTEITSGTSVGNLAIALFSVLFAYSGWDQFGYAVEEVQKPERTIPRAMVTGLTVVALSYFLVNLSFFSVLSREEIIGTEAVALPFGKAVMGKAGLVIFPLLIGFSVFGANLLSMYWATRLLFSSAREGLLPEVFCGVHEKWKTPVAAIVGHTLLLGVYLLTGDIASLIEQQAASSWFFYLLCFVAILIMRFTHRELERPFKIWWIIPVIMIVVSVSLILLPLAKGPGLTLAAFGVALTGVPVYVVFVMETPWRLRPVFLDKWSEFVTKHVNKVLKAKSAR